MRREHNKVNGTPSILPDGYTLGDGVKLNGSNQYFELSTPYQFPVVYDFEFTALSSNTANIFHSGGSSTNRVILVLTNIQGRYDYSYSSSYLSSTGWGNCWDTDVRHVCQMKYNSLTIDGVTKPLSGTASAYSIPNNRTLIGCSQYGVGSTQTHFNGIIHRFKMSKDGTTLVDLYPCTNASNVVGMYDIINNRFYNAINGGILI